MKKQRLLLASIIFLAMVLTIIIYNLMHNAPKSQLLSALNSSVLDPAGTMDTAWFQDASITAHPSLSPLPILPKKIASNEINLEIDVRAMQAPINSNQIQIDQQESNSNANSANPSNPQPAETNSQKIFLAAAQNAGADTLNQSVHNPMSPYELKTTTIIPAILISGINSDLPGPIAAQVRENVYDTISGRYLLIPQGSKLQGLYDSAVAYGQRRVLIVWQRLIFPNGQSLQLSGMPGTDVSGYSGFSDKINNHYRRLFGSALLLSLISAGVQLSQPHFSNNTDSPSVNQTLAQNLGIGLSQTSEMLLQKNVNIQPTLEIRPGYLFNVSITRDIVFAKPYGE